MKEHGKNSVYSIPVMTDEEKKKILFTWNDTDVPFPEDMTIHKLFEQQVLLTPDHTAVICEGKSLTYRELNEKANRLGNAIRGYYHTIYREDILPDTPVGVCINRGVDMIVAILGILKAGCAYMPVDPSYPADRLRFMMDDALAPLVVTEMALLEKLLFLNQADYGIISLDGGWDVISKYSDKNPEQINGPDNLAYIIYTSGSTGRPKGVMIEHKSAVNFICNEKNLRHIAPGDRLLQFASINFDASVTEIYPALLWGATLHIAGNDIRKDPEALYHYVSEQSINDMFLPPPVLHAMPKKDLPSLRSIVVGGDVCNRETLNFWSKGRKVINEYGPTECTVVSNESIYSDGILHNEIGRPIANMKAYILDSHLNPVPEGTEGELYIGGIGVGRGYLNRQSLTDERFIKNPFVTQEEQAKGRNLRLYRTGDLVKWIKGGSIEFIGRADSQVKIRGFRVEPGEIEAVLSSHGEIKDCAVSTYTEGTEKRLIACYVPVPGTCPSIKNLRLHLEELLPDYMIPSVFMEMKALPLSPGGKIDRKSLPAPTQDIILAQREKPAEYIEPESEEEKDICGIIAKILNMEKISIADDLFDLGVHSLMAAQIASEIRNKFSRKIELKDIFEHRTIQHLAEFISKKTGSENIISIPKLTHRKNIPLSFQQEQIWFLSKLVPNNRAYNFQFAIRFKGALDKDILTKSLNEIIRRHEILRTTFCEGIKGPVQIVHAPWKAVIPEIDLRSFPCDKREEEANKLIEEELAQPFDFGRLPLVKWRIYRLEDDDCIFFHMEHHFLHDGWEVAIFLKELMALYTSFKEGNISPLEELPVQYADYAFWQRNYLSGDRLEEKLGYWVNKIRDYPHILNLHADHPRPPVQTFNGAAIRLDMDRSLYHSLREFSKANKVTLFNTMYSAFAVLVSKYSRQTKFLIGTGFANRTFKETENLMGMFVNTVLLYSDLTDNPSFKELLSTTKECMIYDSMHYDIPFMHIVERLKAGNVQGRNPLFQVLFAFHDSAVPLLNFSGIHGKIIEKHNATSKTDINVICIPKAEQHVSVRDANLEEEDITILWEYNSDLFDRETMQGMLEHYLALLELVIKFPEKKVQHIDILIEKEKVLYSFNDNAIDYDRNKTVNELFEDQVRIREDKIALVHNERKLSYGELNREANRLANRLKDLYKNSLSRELLPGTPIGICVERSIEMMTGIIAILKAGGSYVPLPPNYPENRLRFIMDNSDIKIILTQDKIKGELPVLSEERRIVISLDGEANDKYDVSDENSCNRPEDIAYIMYTSGSTGNPKGVSISHGAINNFIASIKADVITENDIISQCANYAFDASTYEFWGALLSGATLVIIDSNKVENLDILKKEITDNNITSAFFTTALFNAIVDCDTEILTPLRSVLFGGEAVNISCVKKLLQVKPQTLNVFHCYGPTECTCFSTYCLITDKYNEKDAIPIGKPLHNYTAYVVDEKMNPVPVGVPGELYIGGDSIAKGYLNRPELTAERFIENPFVTDKEKGRNTRLYKTGDLVRWLPDGNIEFLGRTDFQVKIRGFRIEPEEIESVILKHDRVKQCAVIPWEQYLVAYVVPRDNAISQEELKAFLGRHLPEFMIPRAFIQIEAFKLNNNFKIDRTKLPPPKMEDIISSKREYVSPGTPTEEALAEIWKELLKLDKISINDNFFEIGGNSILTVRMLSSIKRKLGAEVNISQMFSMPTVAYLAAYIDGTGITSGMVEDNLSIALSDSQIEIKTDYTLPGNYREPSAVLLTGITGFLGIYLLDSLFSETKADIYCLVRGHSNDDILERFNKAIAFYRKGHLSNNPRIKLIRGDMGKKRLGLEPEIIEKLQNDLDSIYHCGAYVHHMYDYNMLKNININGVIELLNIGRAGKKKTFNFISTLGSASIRDREGRLVEVDPGDMPVSTNGYNMGKWVIEKILKKASLNGMESNIFRPGNITGDAINGICPPEKNHSLLLLKGCIQMTAAPDWKRTIEMTPADTLSEAIVKLSLNSGGFNIYNMNNPLELSWHDYITMIKENGFDINLVPMNIWKEKYLIMIDERNAMFPVKEFYLKERKDIVSREWKSFSRWNSHEVQVKLKEYGIHYLSNYNDYIKLITGYLLETGFLKI